MPLDTGAVTHNLLMSAGVDMSDADAGLDSVIDGALNIGAALRTARQRLGRSLQDVSDSTRIKRGYLEALEEMRLEELPSRPFTIGYVRAYARTLGLDAEAAVVRFKQDVPGDTEALHAPVGVRKHSDIRISLLIGAGAVVISAVLVWNLAQHAKVDDAAPPPDTISAPAAAAQPAAEATVAVSAAQPAPPESTVPAPYQTPGLTIPGRSADAAQPPTGAALANAANAQPALDPDAPPTFTSHGAVYGAPAAASVITLQAKKSISLVVRAPDGSVRFARQLHAGEAWRAPQEDRLSVDVSEPAQVDVYRNGQIQPGLTANVTLLGKLTAAN